MRLHHPSRAVVRRKTFNGDPVCPYGGDARFGRTDSRLQVDSSTTVIDLVVQNDTFRGVVNGTIRGARTVRINPTGTDTYEVVLEIDRETISYLLTTARKTV